MKTLLTTGLLCTVIGVSVGWWNASEHCKNKAQKLEIATLKAEQERNEAIEGAINGYYELYKNALTVEPVIVERVVTKRLYIKSDCDVQADQAGQMDNGQATGIVRLREEADRSVKQVIREAEADYARVKNQLLACIASIDQNQLSEALKD